MFTKNTMSGTDTPLEFIGTSREDLSEFPVQVGRMKKKIKVTRSNGNIFADIGIPNAAQHSIKADLVLGIAALIKSKGLTQAKAAALLGLAQPDISKLLRGNFAGYTYDRLFSYLNALGEKIRIEVSEAKTKEEARLELEMSE